MLLVLLPGWGGRGRPFIPTSFCSTLLGGWAFLEGGGGASTLFGVGGGSFRFGVGGGAFLDGGLGSSFLLGGGGGPPRLFPPLLPPPTPGAGGSGLLNIGAFLPGGGGAFIVGLRGGKEINEYTHAEMIQCARTMDVQIT